MSNHSLFPREACRDLASLAGVGMVSNRRGVEDHRGRKALDIARQMRAEGIDRPFYCVRVGSNYRSWDGDHLVISALSRTGRGLRF